MNTKDIEIISKLIEGYSELIGALEIQNDLNKLTRDHIKVQDKMIDEILKTVQRLEAKP